MRYEKNSTLYTEREVRESLPNVSLPEFLLPEHVAEFGFAEYIPPEPPDLTPEQIAANLQTDVVARTQQRLDDFARTRGYDDIKSLVDYAGDEDPVFNAEGSYGKQARSRTWRMLYDILAAVEAGERPMPSGFDDIEPELPPLQWPA